MDEAYYLCVYCSEVAACIGCHKYKQVHEVLEAAWKRADPHGYAASLTRNRVVTEEEQITHLLYTHTELADSLRSAESAAKDVHAKPDLPGLAAQVQQVGSNMTRAEQTLTNKHIRTTLFTDYGTEAEETVVDMLNKAGMAIQVDTSLKKKVMGCVNGKPWKLAGRVDGFCDQGKTVVEIKNRVSNLFHTPPLYEVLQVRAYCEVLGLASGKLIEALTVEEGTRISVTDIHRSHDFWKGEVQPKLQRFVEVLVQVLMDKTKQDKLHSSKRKKGLVEAWLQKV